MRAAWRAAVSGEQEARAKARQGAALEGREEYMEARRREAAHEEERSRRANARRSA